MRLFRYCRLGSNARHQCLPNGYVDRRAKVLHGLIEQHLYSHLFQSRNHTDRIVIAQNAIQRPLKMGTNQGDAFECRVKGANVCPR